MSVDTMMRTFTSLQAENDIVRDQLEKANEEVKKLQNDLKEKERVMTLLDSSTEAFCLPKSQIHFPLTNHSNADNTTTQAVCLTPNAMSKTQNFGHL